MKRHGQWELGVTSWSFRCGIDDFAAIVRKLGVSTVQLQLLPALRGDGHWLDAARRMDAKVFSTMLNFEWESEKGGTQMDYRRNCGIGNDAHWDDMQRDFERGIAFTRELGADYVLLHVGHVDYADPERAEVLEGRVRRLADLAAAGNVKILLETGMESGADLRRLIDTCAHPALRVNFDPANLMSFHSDLPLPALEKLLPFVDSVHLKDTVPNPVLGIRGEEKRWGEGEVGADAVFAALEAGGFTGPMFIEREKGTDPVGDAAIVLDRLGDRS